MAAAQGPAGRRRRPAQRRRWAALLATAGLASRSWPSAAWRRHGGASAFAAVAGRQSPSRPSASTRLGWGRQGCGGPLDPRGKRVARRRAASLELPLRVLSDVARWPLPLPSWLPKAILLNPLKACLALASVLALPRWRGLLRPRSDPEPAADAPLPPEGLGPGASVPYLGGDLLDASLEASEATGPAALLGWASRAVGHLFADSPLAAGGGSEDIKEVLSKEFQGSAAEARAAAGAKAGGAEDHRDHALLRGLEGRAMSPLAVAAGVPLMQRAAEDLLRRWLRQGEVCVAEEALRFSQDVAWRQILGLELDDEEAAGFRGVLSAWEGGVVSKLQLPIPGSDFAKSLDAKARLQAMIEEQVIRAEQDSVTRASTLYQLVRAVDEGGARLSRQQIIDDLLLLIYAGQETASSTLSTLALLLGKRPEVLRRLREEQDQLVSEEGEEMTAGFLESCSCLDAVIRQGVGAARFGVGADKSIGAPLALAEVKVFLGMVVRHFDLELLDDSAEWKTQGFIPQLASGVPVRVAPRSASPLYA